VVGVTQLFYLPGTQGFQGVGGQHKRHSHSFLAIKPANCTYQVCACTTLASRVSLAIARLRYIASSGPVEAGVGVILASDHAHSL